MWYNCGVDVEVYFEIDVETDSKEEATEIAVREALKRIKLPSSLTVCSINANEAEDQTSGKVR